MCLATQADGAPLLEELARLGCRVTLLVVEACRDAAWPHGCLHGLETMPGGMTFTQIANTVTYLARTRRFARILALDASSVETAAALRELMRIPGMGQTTARYVTDRLAMRQRASTRGVRVPAFTATFQDEDLHAFAENVPAPWRLTPREISAVQEGDTLYRAEELWAAMEALGDARSNFFVEQAVVGERCFVEGVAAYGKVADVAVVPAAKTRRQEREIAAIYGDVVSVFGLTRGPCGATFLRSSARGSLYFLEMTAVPLEPGARDAAKTTGRNPWVEWARVEVAAMRGEH